MRSYRDCMNEVRQKAFEMGGLEDGSYHLEDDELEHIIQLALSQQAEPAPAQDDGRSAFQAYLNECAAYDFVPSIADAFHFAWQASPGQPIRMPPSPYTLDVAPESMTDYERGEAQGRCDMWAMVKELNAARPAQTEPAECPVCCSDEPHTGTCGSSDPRALCNRAKAETAPAQDEREAFEAWYATEEAFAAGDRNGWYGIARAAWMARATRPAQTEQHESEHHVQLLGQALGECIAAAGIIRPDVSLSGPELLMFADDLKRHLAEQNGRSAGGICESGRRPPSRTGCAFP